MEATSPGPVVDQEGKEGVTTSCSLLAPTHHRLWCEEVAGGLWSCSTPPRNSKTGAAAAPHMFCRLRSPYLRNVQEAGERGLLQAEFLYFSTSWNHEHFCRTQGSGISIDAVVKMLYLATDGHSTRTLFLVYTIGDLTGVDVHEYRDGLPKQLGPHTQLLIM